MTKTMTPARSRRWFFHAIGLGLYAAAALTAAPASAADFVSTVIASGLENPRGLEFGPDRGLYIAEAGYLSVGGPTTVIRGNIFHYAETGSITRYAGGVQQRIVTGLPSIASATSNETTGPSDIAFGADGTGYVAIGLGTDPNARSTDLAPSGVKLGRIFSFNNAGGTSSFADVAAYETANNPVGGPLDSNPFHLAATSTGLLVTDAGSNTLLNVTAGGAVSLIDTFPGRPMGPPGPPISDSVPTGIAIGPDGDYYVAELTGFPFPNGGARIYRLTEMGKVVAYTGFTNITDIAFGSDGSLYVLELDSNGLLLPGGSGTLRRARANGMHETLFSGLAGPTGLAIGSDDAFYVTNFSASNTRGMGQVLRIAAVPEPSTWATMIIGFGIVGRAFRQRRRLKMPLAV